MKPIHLYATALLFLVGFGGITWPQRQLAEFKVKCLAAHYETTTEWGRDFDRRERAINDCLN